MHPIELRGLAVVPGLAWHAQPSPAPVASALQGVWARTLLETPAGRDTSSWVRWVQTARWQGSLSGPPERAPVQQGPGAEHSVFQTPDRIVQTTLQARALAVWERLPGSQGQRIALARRDADGRATAECLLLCGDYLLHTAPPGRGPQAFSFGQLDQTRGLWTVERASHPARIGGEHPWSLQRLGLDLARIAGLPCLAGAWEVLEWIEA